MSSVNTAIQLITREQAHHHGTGRGRLHLQPRAGPRALGLRPRPGPRRLARLRPRRLPRRLHRPPPRARASCRPSTARPPTTSSTPASAPRRRRSATASSSSATSTSAKRSSSTPTTSATRSSSPTPPRPGPRPRPSCSAACTSWPRPPTSSPAAEQAVILPNLAAGCSMADMADIDPVERVLGAARGGLRHRARRRRPRAGHPGHLHELLGGAQGLRRRARRHRLHVVERRARCWSGRSSAASACCSSPTSTSAATPRRPWACRSSRCRCGTRASRSAATTSRAARRPRDPVARLLLGAPALHRRPDREGPRRAPRRAGHRAPGVPDGGRGRRRRGRLDRLHPKAIAAATEPTTFAIGTEINLVQAARRREPAAHDLLPRPGGLPLLDDVPHPPRLPRLGARGARRRRGASTASRWPRTSPTRPGSPSSGCWRRGRDQAAGDRRQRHRRALRRAARRRRGTAADVEVASDEGRWRNQHPLRPGRHRGRALPGGYRPRRLRRSAHRRHPRRRRRAQRPRRRPGALRRGRPGIADLVALGVQFDAELPRGSLGLEAAHSAPRILHAGGDATGACIESGSSPPCSNAPPGRAGHGRSTWRPARSSPDS